MVGDTKRALRRAWFQVHKWIGLLLMIVLVPLSLTGSVLVWETGFDRLTSPARYATTGTATLPPSAYLLAAVRVLAPGARVAQLRYPDGAGPVVVSAAPAHAGPPRGGPPLREMVWLDPPTGRVLDHAMSNTGPLRWAHGFHGALMLPDGRAVVGWLGVVMFVSCVSGLWLWWPASGAVVRGLRWRRGDRRVDSNLHHLVGFWIALPLAMLSFTGAWIAWPQMVGGAVHRPPPPMPVAARLSADAALAAARAVRPGAPAAIAWPTRTEGWRVSLAGGRSRPADVAVDDASGAATLAPPQRRPGGGVMRWVRRWHAGEDMGPVWQAIVFLAGLAPAVLGLTAITMWLRSRRWRRRSRVRAEPERAAA